MIGKLIGGLGSLFGSLDRLFPVAVGSRSELLGFGYFVLRCLQLAGVLQPEVVDAAGELIRPAFSATLAAKINRIGGMLVEAAKPPA